MHLLRFTRYALYTTISTYAAPFSGDWRAEKFEVDFQSGLDNLENFDSPSTFWAHIRTQLLALPSRYPKPITKLLLAGESATDDMFLKVLRDALSEIRGPSHNLLLDQSADGDVNPTFAAARGAALYARIRQEKPFDCSEPKRCEAERQRQRSNENTVRTELK
jgi:hypothetical protein